MGADSAERYPSGSRVPAQSEQVQDQRAERSAQPLPEALMAQTPVLARCSEREAATEARQAVEGLRA